MRLKRPSEKLIDPSQASSVVSGPSAATICPGLDTMVCKVPALRLASTTNAPPRIRLVSGPTIAIQNSAPGECGSRWMLETPPNKKSVMLRTGMPRALATGECASSCSSTTRRRWGDHPAKSAGSRITGRNSPQVIGMLVR